MMKKAVIGIGTNMGDRLSNIRNAVEALSLTKGIEILRVSSVYETAPWGYTEQQSFYNNVIEIKTELTPHALLGACLGIEGAMGRVRQFKNGPRVIDLDVLVYEDYEGNDDLLTVPHPLIAQRDFVLIPLQELFEDVNIYGFLYGEDYKNVQIESTAKKVEKIWK